MERPTVASASADHTNMIVINDQIRECYGKVVYTHKSHEKEADIYFQRLHWLKIAQIMLSAITTGGLIVTLIGEGKAATVLAALASTALLILTTYTKNLDLGELAQKHSDVAIRLWNIRESYLSLLTDIASGGMTLSTVQERRDVLQSELNTVYTSAPRTTSRAYKAAQKGLKVNEELTFSDEEIDQFLPAPLRKTKTRVPSS